MRKHMIMLIMFMIMLVAAINIGCSKPVVEEVDEVETEETVDEIDELMEELN